MVVVEPLMVTREDPGLHILLKTSPAISKLHILPQTLHMTASAPLPEGVMSERPLLRLIKTLIRTALVNNPARLRPPIKDRVGVSPVALRQPPV